MDHMTIINGTIIQHGQMIPADVVIENGVIAEIRQPGYGQKKGQVIDAEGAVGPARGHRHSFSLPRTCLSSARGFCH